MLFIAFLFLLLYICITVGGTTDLQLFLPDSKIVLPLLNTPIPLFGFYLIAPVILWAVHFNLLFNLKLHQIKLTQWHQSNPGKSEKWLLPFLFNYTHILDSSPDSRLLRFILSILIYVLPPGILLWIQIRFAAYQNIWMTFFHVVVVCSDLLILICYWNDVFPQTQKITQQLKGLTTKVFEGLTGTFTLENLKNSIKKVMEGLIGTLYWTTKALKGLTGTLKNLSWIKVIGGLIGTLDWTTNALKGLTGTLKNLSWIKKVIGGLISSLDWITKAIIRLIGLVLKCINVLLSLCIVALILLFFVIALCSLWATDKIISGENPTEIVDSFLIELKKNEHVGSLLSKLEQIKGRIPEELKQNPLVESLLSVPGQIEDFVMKPHLELQDKKLFKKLSDGKRKDCKENIESIEGHDLKERSLNFANFREADLAEIDLRNASLKGANLEGSCLIGANLEKTQFQRAELRNAQFQGAELRNAQFQGAELRNAQFQGAKLGQAKFQGMELDHVEFQGATLVETKFQGAKFSNAQFQGAKLDRTKFQGATLVGTKFQGAMFSNAQFQGAKLDRTKFQGAELNSVQFQGAMFSNALFQGAELNGVQFQGAWLVRAQLRGAVFDNVGGLDKLVVENIDWENGVNEQELRMHYDEDKLLNFRILVK